MLNSAPKMDPSSLKNLYEAIPQKIALKIALKLLQEPSEKQTFKKRDLLKKSMCSRQH